MGGMVESGRFQVTLTSYGNKYRKPDPISFINPIHANVEFLEHYSGSKHRNSTCLFCNRLNFDVNYTKTNFTSNYDICRPFWSEASANAVVVEADAFKETDVIYKALNSQGHHDMLQTAELVTLESFPSFYYFTLTAAYIC